MLKTTAALLFTAALSGCSSTPAPAPFDWKTYVVPMADSEFKTDVQSPDENTANEYALKAAYGACSPGRPVIIERTTSRTGLMGEKTAAAYEVARNAAAVLGHWSPGLNDEEYSAEWLFRCDGVATSRADSSQDQSQTL